MSRRGAQAPSVPVNEVASLLALVRDIGKRFGRSATEINELVEAFKANWLTQVKHW